MPPLQRLEPLLTHPRIGFWAAALACLLGASSLRTGLRGDDYELLARLRGIPNVQDAGHPLDLFAFYRQSEVASLVERGALPWWTLPDSRFALWRPVASATHWLDFKLWPDRPALMHLQSLLWMGALVLLVAHLHRQLLGATWISGLASLLYAVDSGHAVPASSIASRNGTLGALFALGAFALHVRFRSGGSRLAPVLAPFALLLGLLSNEGAVAACGFLLAYALFLDPRRRGALSSLWPHALVVVLWRLAYTATGHGVWGVDRYVDPLRSPLRFAVAILGRAPEFLLDQWALPPLGLAALSPHAEIVVWGLAVGLLFCVVLVLAPLLRTQAVSRLAFLAMLLSVVPNCAVDASVRLLLFTGVGSSTLLAQFLACVRDGSYVPASALARLLARPFYYAWIAIHLLLAPLLYVAYIEVPHLLWSRFARAVEHAPLGDCHGKTLVTVDTRHAGRFVSLLWGLEGREVPARLRHLGPRQAIGISMRLTRPDARTLVVRPEGGFVFPWPRERTRSFAAGDRVPLPGMSVEVREVDAHGRVLEVAYVFDVSLDDESLIWLRWGRARPERFTPPAVGESIVLRRG